jgi:hypothetical protein
VRRLVRREGARVVLPFEPAIAFVHRGARRLAIDSLVNPGTFTFAFDALIVTGDTSPNADLYVGEVDFVPWNIDIEVQYISPGKYSVDLWEVWYVADAGYGVATHAASGTIDTGAWTHFVLVLQTPEAGTSGAGSLSMNNKQVATFVTSNMPSGACAPGFIDHE